jgi:micrococcal nuclease
MKKILFIILMLLFIPNINAETMTLVRCIDGDTARFNINGKEETVRFLAIDTPESTNKIEPYGKEASTYTCNQLKSGNITIEYDPNSDQRDKYDRVLGWIFVDNNLLQEKIIENGYGEVAYLYGDYKYTSILQEAEMKAKSSKVGMWSEEDNTLYYVILILMILGTIFLTTKQKRKIKKIFKIIGLNML